MFFTVHGRGPLGADRGLLKYNQNTSRDWLNGVIGDRVNDARALKWANVDIAVGVRQVQRKVLLKSFSPALSLQSLCKTSTSGGRPSNAWKTLCFVATSAETTLEIVLRRVDLHRNIHTCGVRPIVDVPENPPCRVRCDRVP